MRRGRPRGRRLARPVPRHRAAPGRDTCPTRRVRGIIGPWSHQYPDRGLPPGPAIGFLQETLRWWDHHLKGVDNGVMAEPKLRSWISDSHPPATVYANAARPLGRRPVLAVPERRAPRVRPSGRRRVIVRSPAADRPGRGPLLPLRERRRPAAGPAGRGRQSACFDFEVPSDIQVLGRPRVTLRITSEVPRGQVLVRVCDVAPDGSSTLVTRGVLNLSSREGRDQAVAVAAGHHGRGRLRAERHRPHLPGRAPHPPRGLLRVLAVDLAAARVGSRLHPRTGGQHPRTARQDGRRGERRRHRLRAARTVRADGCRLPGHPGRTAPRAALRPRRRQGRMAPRGRPALRRHPRLPRRPRIHRGRRGDVRRSRSPTRCARAPAPTGRSACTGPSWRGT